MEAGPGEVFEMLASGPDELLLPTEALSQSFVLAPEEGEQSGSGSTVSESTGRRGFRIGTIGLVPQPGTLCEIIERPRIFPIPNTADYCLGMINLRGMLLPAFRVHPLLGAQGAEASDRWFIVIGQGAQAGALCIDGLPVQVELSSESRIAAIPPLPDILHAQVLGGYQSNGDLWFEFDHARLFNAIAER